MKPIFFAIIILLLLFSVMFLPSSTLAAPVVAKRGDEYREAAAYIGKNSYLRAAHPPPPSPLHITPHRPRLKRRKSKPPPKPVAR
ncbi:hypothetical protein HN51_006461 [Arachis hypogaea]|nr:uncharacterized protein DS421_14g486250 [Arachis hypogaea]